jgi:hypothetical protein
MGRAFAFATLVVGGLIIADLWAHASVTTKVLSTGQTVAGYVAGK